MKIHVSIQCSSAGWFVQWCREDPEGEVEVNLWWAGRVADGRKACEERAKRPPPKTGWVPAVSVA